MPWRLSSFSLVGMSCAFLRSVSSLAFFMSSSCQVVDFGSSQCQLIQRDTRTLSSDFGRNGLLRQRRHDRWQAFLAEAAARLRLECGIVALLAGFDGAADLASTAP